MLSSLEALENKFYICALFLLISPPLVHKYRRPVKIVRTTYCEVTYT